jgi:excisionase family DNA binding protein
MNEPRTSAPPRLAYSIKEVGTALGLSKGAVYKMIQSGQLRSVKVKDSRRRVIPAAEVDRFLDDSAS